MLSVAYASGSDEAAEIQCAIMTLIDGYNLLHALGMAPRPGGMSLERSRLRFAEWLAVELGSSVSDVCVVFDGQGHGRENEQFHRGLRMLFSAGEKADDLIERLIREEPSPARLKVVSNDLRITHAAARRDCKALSCGEFIDSLHAATPKRPPLSETEKPEASDDDLDEWLEKFGT